MLKKKLEELVEFAESTDLAELVWEKKGIHISFRRSAHSEKPHASKTVPSPAVSVSVPRSNGLTALPKPPDVVTIKSSMVGTFFRSDSANRPPLVVEGTVVTAGQPVAAIEAMKIMKDVVASVPCKIIKALVANGHPVEYGQSLFEIELMPEEKTHV